jgi:hypothetical protein
MNENCTVEYICGSERHETPGNARSEHMSLKFVQPNQQRIKYPCDPHPAQAEGRRCWLISKTNRSNTVCAVQQRCVSTIA